jgi:hypothetical protein
MPNPYGAPEISAQAVDQKRQQNEAFIWLDVREPNEQALVHIDAENVHLIPLSRLAQYQLDALPEPGQRCTDYRFLSSWYAQCPGHSLVAATRLAQCEKYGWWHSCLGTRS